MTIKLNKSVWPYNIYFKDKDNWEDNDTNITERLDWIRENLNENIRNRIFIIEDSTGMMYYFKEEKDYQWFLWRWV